LCGYLKVLFCHNWIKITHSKSTSKGISTRDLLEEVTFIEVKGISIKDLLEEAKSIGNLLGKTSFVVGAVSPHKNLNLKFIR
jgi:hypothetical protein